MHVTLLCSIILLAVHAFIDEMLDQIILILRVAEADVLRFSFF
jgi:hypothetical protein